MALKRFVRNDNNIAVCYFRYSSENQSDISIVQQREKAYELAEKQGLKIVEEYVDEAKTGRTTVGRDNFNRMLHDIAKLKPAYLIVWKNDRLGRDRKELMLSKEQVRKCGVDIIATSEAYIPYGTSQFVITDGMADLMAEWYSVTVGENITRGMEFNAKHSLFNGRKVFGYTTGVTNDYGNKPKYKYVIDKKTAPIVKRIFDDYLAGIPMSEIANGLNEQGIRTNKGNEFTINSLRGILQNESYIGTYSWGGIRNENGMPAIIDKATFEGVQKKFAENKRKGAQRAYELNSIDTEDYWLTGVLFCGKCGSSMHSSSGTSKTGKVHHYYGCRNHMKKKRCDKKRVRKDWIETLVIQILQEFLRDTEKVASLAVDICEYNKAYYSGDSTYLDALQSKLADNEKSIGNIIKAIEQGIITNSTKARLEELERQKEELEGAIQVEEAKSTYALDENSVKSYFLKFANNNLADEETRGLVLDYFIDKIYLYDDKIVLTGKYDDGGTYYWDEMDDDIFVPWKEFDDLAPCSTINQERMVFTIRFWLS